MYTELKIYDNRLSDEEVRTVWRIVSSAKTKRICVSDRPDIVFCYKTDKGEDNFLSVYLKDAYIYMTDTLSMLCSEQRYSNGDLQKSVFGLQ